MSTPVKKKRNPFVTILIILGGLFVLFIIIGTIGNSTPSGQATSTARSQTQAILVSPTETQMPNTATPADPAKLYEEYIAVTLGFGNRDVPRLRFIEYDAPTTGDIRISWNINDNLTEEMIKTGIQTDARDLLRAVDEGIMPFQRVILEGYFPMVDAYGNTSDEMIVHLIFNKETVDKISWEGFLYENIYNIADNAVLAPAIQ
jgi:hypothetical protein